MYKVEPDDLHKHWAFVRNGLETILKTAKDGWIPEDVYTSLRNGTAFLFVEDGNGFIVINVLGGYAGREMHIWCAYGNEDGKYSVIIEELAQSLGCSVITFFSSRKGWERNAFGYEPVHTLYRKIL